MAEMVLGIQQGDHEEVRAVQAFHAVSVHREVVLVPLDPAGAPEGHRRAVVERRRGCHSGAAAGVRLLLARRSVDADRRWAVRGTVMDRPDPQPVPVSRRMAAPAVPGGWDWRSWPALLAV